MEGTYPIMLGQKQMGQAEVLRQGLYWHFHCSCDLCGEVMYYLAIQIGDDQRRLGILAPNAGKFALDTKIATKRLPQGSPVFFLQPKHSKPDAMFVPVRPEEPFAYLHRLEDAYLGVQHQQLGIFLPQEK